MSTEYLLVGRVRRAHGIRGELAVEALTDAPDAVFAPGRRVLAGTREGDLSPDARELRITHSSPFKGGWIVAVEGIGDRSAAQAWRNRYLLLPAVEVDPPAAGELFIHDLVGMRVVRASGDEVGHVSKVLELPQGLIIDVRRPTGRSVLLPFDDHTVTEVDEDRRVIHVDPVEGLID